MWFCPGNVDQTWQTTSSITHASTRVPLVWPVKEGTNITHEEVVKLEKAGFRLEQKPIGEQERETCQQIGVFEAANKRIQSATIIEAIVVHHRVLKPNKHEHFGLQTSTSELANMVYDVHISKNPCCSCPTHCTRTIICCMQAHLLCVS